MGRNRIYIRAEKFGLLALIPLYFIVVGLMIQPLSDIIPGLWRIIKEPDFLITDYFLVGGIGAAFINAGILTLAAIGTIYFLGMEMDGHTITSSCLMFGFSLFGKNLMNIWAILLGVYLYSKYHKTHMSRYIYIGFYGTSLSPIITQIMYITELPYLARLPLSILVGIAIGFVLPPLSAYTYKIQNGMNLYNMGFACGLLAMILVPVMSSMGANPTVAHHWAEGYNLHFAIFLGVLCLGLTVAGFFFSGRPAWAAWAGYRRLLRTTGRAPSDYLRMFGPAPVLINMGVNGLIGMAFILATGGDLNGPTLGGILTIMGFSAFGKHARNITPIMLGVVIGGVFMHFDINQSSVQLALLFGTTLAPISGYFGWPFGIVAGFLHSSVVLHAGTPVEGINLYNNGFSGGLLAIVLYPIISEAIRHHRPGLQDRDYFDDTIEHDEPLVPPPARRK